MSDLRFHVSGSRFHLFPARFPTLRAKEPARFLFVSSPFPCESLRFPFPTYRCETRNEACFAAPSAAKNLA
jgi:hypothetical protein